MNRSLAIVSLLTLMTAAHAQVATVDLVRFRAGDEGAPMLAGELSLPARPSPEAQVPAVIICHPNPLMKGSRYDPVVLAIREQCLALGLATLTFDFRGVGASEGEARADATCVADVLGALEFLRAQPAIAAARVGLAGYSFGAQMAIAACSADPAVRACVAVAYPTGHDLPVVFEDYAALQGLRRPLLFVTGADDQYASIAKTLALVEPYGLNARVIPIEGADHFFADPERRIAMATYVAQFLAVRLTPEV